MVAADPRRGRPVGALSVSPPYDLARTLTCGQAFGWSVDGASATGIFEGRRIRLEQFPRGPIAVEGVSGDGALERLRCYLALDAPLREIEAQLSRDPVLARALRTTSGIAILRQDPWECLVSFIISAFNNIPRIELILRRLRERFGAFPSPEALASASPALLRACGLGYRIPYVRGVARLVDRGTFDVAAPAGARYDEARRMLLALPGVGEKVADCVLLFGYGKGEAFPVDVWVQRAVERRYFGGRPLAAGAIRAFARARFGPLAGYAQQHLFADERSRAGRRSGSSVTAPSSWPRSWSAASPT